MQTFHIGQNFGRYLYVDKCHCFGRYYGKQICGLVWKPTHSFPQLFKHFKFRPTKLDFK